MRFQLKHFRAPRSQPDLSALPAALAALTKLTGSETKARAILTSNIPVGAAAIDLLFAPRKRGRPATTLQRRKDKALLQVYDWKAAERKSVRAIARYIHKLGVGASDESVERKLHRLLKARSAESRDHRP